MNPAFRNVLFQVHLWIGLGLGLVLALIGLSGTVLVYDHELLALGAPPLPQAARAGTALPLTVIIDAARNAVPDRRAQMTLTLP